MRGAKIFSVVLTALVVGVLVISGPAFAFDVFFDVKDDSVKKGEKVQFDVEIDIGSAETVDIDFLTVNISGPISVVCSFEVDGMPISGCDGVSIKPRKKSDDPSFGYGYGFSDGKLQYKIKIRGNVLDPGEYESAFVVVVSGSPQDTEGPDFSVENKKKDKIKICHVPGGNSENERTLFVSRSAVKTHLSHGDSIGECEDEDEHEDDDEGEDEHEDGDDKQDHDDDKKDGKKERRNGHGDSWKNTQWWHWWKNK